MEIPKFDMDTPIGYLQDFQTEYDEQYLTHNKGDLSDIRHTLLHLIKLTGKLAIYVEQKEHGIDVSTEQLTNEAIPDLFLHAIHLANVFQLPIEALYQRRIEANIKRIEEERQQKSS